MEGDAMKCISCKGGAELKPAVVKHHLDVGEQRFEAELAGEHCPKCGETYFAGDRLEGFEALVAAWLAREGQPMGPGLKFMRKAGLAMPAIELANLLDVAPETLSRWETGERDLPRAAWATVSAMVLERHAPAREHVERATMEQRLQHLAHPRPLAKVIPLRMPSSPPTRSARSR